MWRREGDDRCGGEKVMIDVVERGDDDGEMMMWWMIDVVERR